MSIRRLAGSRRNKHLPIARATTPSDRMSNLRQPILRVGRILGFPILDFARPVPKPDHTARAVDIRTIWPPLPAGDTTKQRKAAEAGARGVSAAPMGRGDRLDAYRRQNGCTTLTYRQWRQLDRMQLRAALTAAH